MKKLCNDTSLVIINDVTQLDDDGRVWHVNLDGPAGGPYEGGKFDIEIRFGDSYPREPPRLKVLTPIFHCNIHPQWTSYYVEGGSGNYEPGSICMVSFFVIFCRLNHPSSHPKTFEQNTLDKAGWSVVSTVVTLFDEFGALLASPNDKDPLNFLAGNLYQGDKEEYYKHAEHFTDLFAKPNSYLIRQHFTTAMALHLKQKGVPIRHHGINSTIKILQNCEVQYHSPSFDAYLDQFLMPAINIQQGVNSHGGQIMSNQESEGGSNNESDDDVVYLGTVRPRA